MYINLDKRYKTGESRLIMYVSSVGNNSISMKMKETYWKIDVKDLVTYILLFAFNSLWCAPFLFTF